MSLSGKPHVLLLKISLRLNESTYLDRFQVDDPRRLLLTRGPRGIRSYYVPLPRSTNITARYPTLDLFFTLPSFPDYL